MRRSLPVAATLLTLIFTGVAGAQVAFRGYGDLAPGSLPGGDDGGRGGNQPLTGYGGVSTSAGYAESRSGATSYLAAAPLATPPLPSDGGAPTPVESLALPSPSYSRGLAGNSDLGAGSCNWTDCGGQWNVGLDALFTSRMAGCSFPFLRVIPGHEGEVPDVCADTADFKYNWQFGYRISASYLTDSGWGLEFGFFGIADGWKYDADCIGPYEFMAAGITNPPITEEAREHYQISDQTQFYSTQFNAVHGLCDWATLRVGARWISMEDTLFVNDLTIRAHLYDANVKNNLLGPQIGADFKLLDLCGSRLRFYATTNVGLLYNYLSLDESSARFRLANRATCPELSLLGELGLTAKWRLTDHLAVRGGYYALALNNVGLAADQMAVNDLHLPYSRIAEGSLVVHGATLGCEVFW